MGNVDVVAPSVPVQDLDRVTIAVTTALCAETRVARYLLYRATELWPACVAQDKRGEQYSFRGHVIPATFTILQDVGQAAHAVPTIDVVILPDRITLAVGTVGTSPEESSKLMEHLANDPIWGAAWLLPVTRYFVAVPADTES